MQSINSSMLKSSITIRYSQVILYPQRIETLYAARMDINDVIAKWITDARMEAKLSQDALGAKLAMELGHVRGHTKQNISHWETKKHQPSVEQVLAISKITGKKLPAELLSAFSQESNKPTEIYPNPLLGASPSKLIELITVYLHSNKQWRDAIDIAINSAKGELPSHVRDELERDRLGVLG